MKRDLSGGYGIITKQAMKHRNISIVAKAIYAYLCAYAVVDDECYPSVKKIMYDLNIKSSDRFYKHMKQLIDNELVEKHLCHDKKSKQFSSNIYRVLI